MAKNDVKRFDWLKNFTLFMNRKNVYGTFHPIKPHLIVYRLGCHSKIFIRIFFNSHDTRKGNAWKFVKTLLNFSLLAKNGHLVS